MPEGGELKIEIYGELAALLSLGQEHENKHPRADAPGVQVTLVAGARSQRFRTRVSAFLTLPL